MVAPNNILYFDNYRNELSHVDIELADGSILLKDRDNPSFRPLLILLSDCSFIINKEVLIIYVDKKKQAHIRVPENNSSYETILAALKSASRPSLIHSKVALLISGLILLLVATGFLFIVVFPSISIRFISIKQEIEMGDHLYTSLIQEQKMDAAASELVQEFANQLRLSRQYPIKVSVAVSAEVNAYALPGGHIIINSALLQSLQTPESLAALLSHESTHINQRHSLKNILSNMSTGFLVSLLTTSGGGFTQFIIGNANSLRVLSYSRKLEKEADHEGMVLMEKNDLNPRGMKQLMEQLNESTDANTNSKISFLSTHPLTEERIEDANQFIKMHPVIAQPLKESLQESWKQLKARVKEI